MFARLYAASLVIRLPARGLHDESNILLLTRGTSMKLLVAYDTSDASRAALDGLVYAGLPEQVDATVLTITSTDIEPVVETDAAATDQGHFTPAGPRTQIALDRAFDIASEGVSALQAHFPGWQIRAAAHSARTPAEGILEEIGASAPDLVVVGSHRRSALGRIIHGSVAQRVLADARCSLRIGHTSSRSAERKGVLVTAAFDGSEDSFAAIREIARRAWPEDSAVVIVSVVNPLPEGISIEADDEPASRIIEWMRREAAETREAMQDAADLLLSRRLSVFADSLEGHPASALLEHADRRKADVIFLGAQGHGLLERIMLGSVSSSIVAHSRRAVEIVRLPAME